MNIPDNSVQHRENLDRLNKLEANFKGLQAQFEEHKALTASIKSDTKEVVDILKYAKGVVSFLNVIAKVGKWITAVGGAAFLMWYTFKELVIGAAGTVK